MKKLVLLVALLAVSSWMGIFEPTLAEAATCSTTCSEGSTLQCCTSGTCSTSHGVSVNCNGTVMTCSAIDAYDVCIDECIEDNIACTMSCDIFCNHCGTIFNVCKNQCGPKPTTRIGC